MSEPLIPALPPITALSAQPAALREALSSQPAAPGAPAGAVLIAVVAPAGEEAGTPGGPHESAGAEMSALPAWARIAADALAAATDSAAEDSTAGDSTDAVGGPLAAPDLVALAAAYGPPSADGARVSIPLPTRGTEGGLRQVILAAATSHDPAATRRALAGAARAAANAAQIWVLLAETGHVDAALEGLLLAGPTRHWGPGDAPEASPAIRLLGDPDPQLVRLGTECARATLTARALANTPSNVKNPGWLAQAAREIAEATGVSARVFSPEELRQQGFGGILAVGQGSATPPRLVELRYQPQGASGAPIVLVGKGITFDTGGLNIKPSAAMLNMKTDMSGAAIVLAVLAGCRALGVRRPVIGLLPLAENAVGSNSYRPSDVITHFGGTTVEVGNTDAEGRMVLADALAYAAQELGPHALVDIATLTGAARVALASSYAASFGSDDALHSEIAAACAAAGEPLWRLPLVEEYRGALDSAVADLSHIGPPDGPGAGSVIAALFLREFTGGVPWVHLDIAGVGRSESDTGMFAKGATGYGARGLLRWLLASE